MARRHDDRRNSFNDAAPRDWLDALERDDHDEMDRLRTELLARDEPALLELEHRVESAARERPDGEGMLDRIRNVFQAILLRAKLRSGG